MHDHAKVEAPAEEFAEFSALLKRLRVAAGLSQRSLADRALVSVQAVSALERGYRRAPYRETLVRLADALNLTPEARDALETAAGAARERGPKTGSVGLGPRLNNLPRLLTSFLGRGKTLDEIAALVDTSPLVTIVGTGGVGKTRAAIEVARRLSEHVPQGVWFVDLALVADPAMVLAAIASAVGFQEGRRGSLLDALVGYLEHRQLLIVLDNCEHVVDEARRVAVALVQACPRIGIIATSREALGVSGERAYRIPPLDFPSTGLAGADEALTYGAVALFCDRALSADSRFVLTDENAAAVCEITRRLDGLPLAIELAAARVTVLSPRQLAERLESAFGVLSAGDRSVLPRQQTMRAAIDWSYGLLSEQSRLLFDRLSLFSGGFTLDAAAVVCADERLLRTDVFDLLSSLVDKSLVAVDFTAGDARYRLLGLTRQYALEKLQNGSEREALARRHALFYLELAERLDRNWYTADEQAWIAEAELELDNFRTALEWSLGARGDLEIARRLAGALARVWYSVSAAEGSRWVSVVLDTGSDGSQTASCERLHVADAELHAALGQYKPSLEAAERALAIAAHLGDPLALARAQQVAGAALAALGKDADSDVLLQRALEGARALNNGRLRAMALGDLGTARSRRGDMAGARAYYAEALSVYRTLNLERPAASIFGHLAEVEFAGGDATAALENAEEALARHAASNNQRSVANDLCNMAAYLLALDRFEEARVHSIEALLLARNIRARILAAFALQHIAAVAAQRSGDGEMTGARLCKNAAGLLGFVDARLAALEGRREHTEQSEYEHLISTLRASVETPELERLMAEGAEWSEDRAVRVALEEL